MGGRILLVEDDPLSRRGFARLLESEGYVVHDVENGSTALELIENFSFDAVISDFNLKSYPDGLEVLGHFNQLFPAKCKILISGTVTDLRKRCNSVGALYFQKPLLIQVFLVKLKELLQNQHANGEIVPLIAFVDTRSQWRASVRQRSLELKQVVQATRARYEELRERSLALQREFTINRRKPKTERTSPAS